MTKIIIQGEKERKNDIHYEVDIDQPPIGEGGMGIVRKGIRVEENTGVSRPVAIKFVFDDLPKEAIERARREASIMLRNDNLVEMLGFIEVAEQTHLGETIIHYHIVSELLYGVSLSDILDGKCTAADGAEVPFAVKMLQDYRNDPEHFAKFIVINVLSGLMALHDAKYIHRDIDPSNIMLTGDGHVKLIDFGIAKQMNNLTTHDKSLTVAGNFMGKPEYAAPELALGDIKHQDQTTDIYAVGILLYQCILGHVPFEGARHEILEKQIKKKIPLQGIKDKNLRNVISVACQKNQAQRYQTAAQMRVALETPAGSKQVMSSNKKYSIIGGAAAILLAVVASIVIVIHKQNTAKEEVEKARIESEFRADMMERMNNAESLFEAGQDKEDDLYYQKLIKAYTEYSDIQKSASENKSYDLSFPEIDKKKSEITSLLTSSIEDFRNKASQMTEMGENDMASEYNKQADEILSFLSSII